MSSTTDNNPSEPIASTNPQMDKVRVLLNLWAIAGAGGKVKKSDLNTKAKQKRKEKKIGIPQGIYEELEAAGAIKIFKEKQTPMVVLTEQGKHLLIESLKNSDFEFDGTVIASRLANALVELIRELDTDGHQTASVKKVMIKSYEQFKAIALQVYDQLNKDYNFDNLVPIYRIRRTIGDQVSRSQFNEWMLEMQANDIFQLTGGEMADITPDKREDSITLPSGGFRYYIQRLDSDK